MNLFATNEVVEEAGRRLAARTPKPVRIDQPITVARTRLVAPREEDVGRVARACYDVLRRSIILRPAVVPFLAIECRDAWIDGVDERSHRLSLSSGRTETSTGAEAAALVTLTVGKRRLCSAPSDWFWHVTAYAGFVAAELDALLREQFAPCTPRWGGVLGSRSEPSEVPVMSLIVLASHKGRL